MNYYKNRQPGRPTNDERAMIQAINRVIEQKQIPGNEIPDCQDLDDLIQVKLLVDAYKTKSEFKPIPKDEPTTEIDKAEEWAVQPEPDSENETRLSESFSPKPENKLALEPDELAELDPDLKQLFDESEDGHFIAEDYDPFADPVIERGYTQAGYKSEEPEGEEIPLDDAPEGTPLDDLPPNTKRRAAEQTAGALLKTYARLVPIPFKWMAKVPEEKVEKMSMEGEIDITLEVSEGTTFEDYMRQTNEQVDEMFEVEADTLDEIKEPLVEVLMEQQLELTPTQRLSIAIVSHIMQMFTVAFKLRKQNNRILDYQRHITQLMRNQARAAA